MFNCCVEECTHKYYASGYCRNHYRTIVNKESQRRWQKAKADPLLYQKLRVSQKKWEAKMKGTEYMRTKNRKASYKNYHKDGKRREYLNKWKANLSEEKLKEYKRKDEYTRHFGSWKTREAAIIRDGEKCTECGITRKEHLEKWKQDLHVDHIDNYGRNLIKSSKNNKLENLKTYCIRCHRRKSARERKDAKRLELLLYGLEFSYELKEQVRIKYGRKCFDCKKPEKELKRKLDVHHLDGNKHNNVEENLIPLCVKCHYWRELSKRKPQTL